MNICNEFHIPNGIYLLNHSVGCLPKKSRLDAEKFFTLWADKGAWAWKDWLMVIDEFCSSLSRLLNSCKEAFCPQSNISSALVKILYSLPKRKSRNKILLSELDFPSAGFVLQQAQKLGYELEYIQPNNGEFSLELWEAHLQRDVQMAFITHVLSENSYQNSVSEITKLAKKNEIFTVVDIAQSVGVIPIDLKCWAADFIIGCSVKWLCGGPGAAFLWVNLQNIDQFTPLDVGWFSHVSPFDFDIHHFQYAQSALRFLGGTPSILPLFLAQSSIDKMMSIGVKQIYQHNQKLLGMIESAAYDLGLSVNSPFEQSFRGNTLVIKFKNQKKVLKNLMEKKIMIDERPKFGIRISPHIYNTEDEIHEVIRVLETADE